LRESAYVAGTTNWNDYIMPACIPTVGTNYDGKLSWATGWGTLSSGAGTLPNVLYQVSMPVWSDSKCQAYSTNVHTPTQVCGGGPTNIDTCQGDSGGPLVVKHDADDSWYLMGLTSWGYGCGGGGVYTRVSAFYDWVMTYIGSL